MNRPTFLEGVAVALGASVAGSVLYSVFASMFATGGVVRLLVAGISLGYVLYLLGRTPARVGRVTTIGLWAVVAIATWFLSPPLIVYLLVHLGVVWLVRSLYFYSSILSALADLGLNGLGLAAGIWAIVQSGSVFLSLWCFFLVQALFAGIPARIRGRAADPHLPRDSDDRFERAHHAAQTALRKFSAIR